MIKNRASATHKIRKWQESIFDVQSNKIVAKGSLLVDQYNRNKMIRIQGTNQLSRRYLAASNTVTDKWETHATWLIGYTHLHFISLSNSLTATTHVWKNRVHRSRSSQKAEEQNTFQRTWLPRQAETLN